MLLFDFEHNTFSLSWNSSVYLLGKFGPIELIVINTHVVHHLHGFDRSAQILGDSDKIGERYICHKSLYVHLFV